MIFIRKLKPPSELDELKRSSEDRGLTENEAYNTLRNPLKQRVRDLLVKEQGHLCAYCMRRIPDERISDDDENLADVYIEHWQARSLQNDSGFNKSLDYNNMLAVCSGNEKVKERVGRHKKRFLTCDKKRENRRLKVNPLDAALMATIFYSADGFIKSSDSEIEDDLNIRLNLNCNEEAVTLPKNRKAALDVVQEQLSNMEGDYVSNCKELLGIWEAEEDFKTPYVGIIIWWLKFEISKIEAV